MAMTSNKMMKSVGVIVIEFSVMPNDPA